VAEPNLLLRKARLALASPSGSGGPMSRQELADAVNRHLHAAGVSGLVATAGYVARLERGCSRWPRAAYREALRAVLGVSSDAELGFALPRAWVAERQAWSEPVLNSEHVDSARRDLGWQLTAARHAARLTQVELAERVGCPRSTLANIETGKESGGRRFWDRADRELAAGGVLVKAYKALHGLVDEHLRQRAMQHRTAQARARGLTCGCGLVVGRWTPRDVRALREAMRLPVRDFSRRMGVSIATVTAWERHGRAKPVSLAAQAALDAALKLADRDVRGRFIQLRADYQGREAGSDRPAAGAERA